MKHFKAIFLSAVLLVLSSTFAETRRKMIRFHAEPATSAADIIQKVADTHIAQVQTEETINKNFNIRLAIGNDEADFATGYISAKKILAPETDLERLALSIQLDAAPKAGVADFLVSHSPEYLLPYRLADMWHTGNPTRGKRFISCSVFNKGQPVILMIRFEDCITSDEQQRLVTKIRETTASSNGNINAYKRTIIEKTTGYISSSNAAELALKDKPTIEAGINTLTNEISALEDTKKNIEVSQPKNLAELNSCLSALQDTAVTINKLQQDYTNEANAKKSKEVIIANLEKGKADTAASKAQFSRTAEEDKNKYNASQSNLSAIAQGDNASNYISAANTGFANRDQNSVESNINRIIS